VLGVQAMAVAVITYSASDECGKASKTFRGLSEGGVHCSLGVRVEGLVQCGTWGIGACVCGVWCVVCGVWCVVYGVLV
jgi:hypothetical protein